MLDLLAKRNNNEAFEHFVEALRKPYPWLSQKLEAEVPKANQLEEGSFLDSLLVGGLPQAPRYHVERKEKVMYVLLYFVHLSKMSENFTENVLAHGLVYMTLTHWNTLSSLTRPGSPSQFNTHSSARRLRHRCRLLVILAFCQ